MIPNFGATMDNAEIINLIKRMRENKRTHLMKKEMIKYVFF